MSRFCIDCGLGFEPKANPNKLRCVLCRDKHIKASHAAYYAKHREKYRGLAKAWRVAHPEKHRELCRNWLENNKERHRDYVRRYYVANKPRLQAYAKAWWEGRRQATAHLPKSEPLQYPYLRSASGEHVELVAVSALISRSVPDYIRADACQEMLLAIWLKQTTVAELTSSPALVRKFISMARKANCEAGGYALSLDAPGQDGRTLLDRLAAEEPEQDLDEAA